MNKLLILFWSSSSKEMKELIEFTSSFADSQNKIKSSKRMFGNFDIKNIEAATRLYL